MNTRVEQKGEQKGEGIKGKSNMLSLSYHHEFLIEGKSDRNETRVRCKNDNIYIETLNALRSTSYIPRVIFYSLTCHTQFRLHHWHTLHHNLILRCFHHLSHTKQDQPVLCSIQTFYHQV